MRPLLYRNQAIDLLWKSMDWFLYDNDLRHERVNILNQTTLIITLDIRAVGKEGQGRAPFPGAKYFFPRKVGKYKIFTCEEHIRLECIY